MILTNKRFVRQAALVVLPKLIAGAGTVIVGLILVRFMEPTQFGVLSLCLSALMMTDGLLGSAFDLAAVRVATALPEADCTTTYSVQQSCILLKLAAVAIASVLLLLLHRWLLDTFFGSRGGASLLLTPLAGCAVLLLRSTQIHFQLEKHFSTYGLIDLGHSAFKAIGIGCLIAAGRLTPASVLMVYFTVPALIFVLWANHKGRPVFARKRFSTVMVRRGFDQARWYLLTFGIGTLVARADLWLVARYTNVHTAGVYSAAQVVALIPPMIGTYLSVVISPRVMPLLNSGRLLATTARVQISLLLASALGYAMVLTLLPRMSSLLPGRFNEALPVLLALLPGSLAGFVSFPLTLTTLMFLRPRFLVTLDAATVPVILVAYSMVVPRFGVIGAAWVSSSVALGRAAAAQILVLMSIWRVPVQSLPAEGMALTANQSL